MPFADTRAMNAHLAEIARTVAPGAHAILVLVLVLVLDGAGWHGAGALIVPDNLSLVTLPPYAPELDPIENVCACLRGHKLAITVSDSYDAIVAKCCEAWNFFANDPSTVASITSRGWAEVSS
jgi:transposase